MILDIILIAIVLLAAFLYYKQDLAIKQQLEYIEALENQTTTTIQTITETIIKMREIDSRGGFESDDEVGQIFKTLLDEIAKLENEIIND
tara:strand:+ start:169 stop:438 length:270 start_codon:yes stop_codon:yes gene_type:complete